MKFPPLCINCAAGANQQLPIRRVFTYRDEDGSEESCEVESINVPVCASCADRHRLEYKPIPFFTRLLPALKSELTLMFLGPFLTGLFFFSEAVKKRSVALLVFTGFLWLIAAVLWSQILSRSHQFGVAADTIVSGSFIFSSRRKQMFEPERRRFDFRNQAVGDAFAALNGDKLWDSRSPKAINARSNRAILKYALFAGLGLYAVWALVQAFLIDP